MATRMRYGPRFRSSAVSVGNRINVYVPPTVKFQTEEQRMFGSAKRHGTMSKVAMPKFSFSGRPGKSTRDIAEKRLIERLAEAIRLIEYGLAELAEAPPPPKIQVSKLRQPETNRSSFGEATLVRHTTASRPRGNQAAARDHEVRRYAALLRLRRPWSN